jgi:hypothetical protein
VLGVSPLKLIAPGLPVVVILLPGYVPEGNAGAVVISIEVIGAPPSTTVHSRYAVVSLSIEDLVKVIDDGTVEGM